MRIDSFTLLFLNFIFWSCLAHGSNVQDPVAKDSSHLMGQYLEIINSGQHSPELYANLGYLFYQNNDLANSVLHYEKSLKLDPTNKQNRNALAQVKSELSVKITKIPDFILWRFYSGTMNLMSSKAWSITQIFLFTLLLVFLYKWLFLRPFAKKYMNWALLSSLILLMTLSCIFTYGKLQEEIGGKAAISMEHQSVYKAADERSEAIVAIGPGNKVYILDTIGEWNKIQLEDRDVGWIKSKSLRTI